MAVRAWLLLANIKTKIIINNNENHNFSYYYHQKNAHLAVVAPGQYYSYERKRTEIYTEVRLHKQIKSSVFLIKLLHHVLIIRWDSATDTKCTTG